MLTGLKNVIIMVSRSDSFGNDLIVGVIEYSKFSGNWALTTELPPYLANYHHEGLKYSLEESDFDGVIAYIPNKQKAEMISFGSVPAVIAHYTEESRDHKIPYIICDNYEIGKLASNFFSERGYNNRGFFGFRDFDWSVGRRKGYIETNASLGVDTDMLLISSADFKSNTDLEKQIVSWLENLKKPACILCANDDLGLYLIKLCKRYELKVPDRISILGVDNNEVDCNLTSPSLSSISYNSQKAGFQAAQTLDLLMNGNSLEENKIIIPPAEVINRMSTNTFATSDVDVLEAVKFIKNNSRAPLQVEDVAKAVNVSRRTLSRKFRKNLGRSVSNEIKRAHIETMSHMLTNSHMTVSEIAYRMGFIDASHISRYFKMQTGMTPIEYRNNFSVKNNHLF